MQKLPDDHPVSWGNTMATTTKADNPDTTPTAPVPKITVTLLAIYLFAFASAAGLAAYNVWPGTVEIKADAAAAAPPADAAPAPGVKTAASEECMTAYCKAKRERHLVRFVMYLGVLGACIHALTSMATYVGNKTFIKSWSVWYLSRPIVGGLLAWIVFLVFRGGFLGQATDVDSLNPYAFGALGAISGLFSKRVIDKLSELVDTVFRMPEGKGDGARADKPLPGGIGIDAIDPDPVSESVDPVSLTITGRGFTANCVVDFAGAPLTPSEITATSLKVSVPPDLYTGRKSVDVVVRTLGDAAVASNAFALKVKK